jgi:hypothetical protein
MFGPSEQDIQTITTWLRSHGFEVANVSPGRHVIEFSGTASQVQEAFHTKIHHDSVNGEEHWANSSDPQIPAALAPVVVKSLHDFRAKPTSHYTGLYRRDKATGETTQISGPQFTFTSGGVTAPRKSKAPSRSWPLQSQTLCLSAFVREGFWASGVYGDAFEDFADFGC